MQLPAPYDGWLRSEPLDARIVELGETTMYPEKKRYKNRVTLCTIDVGRDQGVFEGMSFYHLADRGRSTVRVEEVREESAVVSVSAKPDWAMPEEGWRLSTRL